MVNIATCQLAMETDVCWILKPTDVLPSSSSQEKEANLDSTVTRGATGDGSERRRTSTCALCLGDVVEAPAVPPYDVETTWFFSYLAFVEM